MSCRIHRPGCGDRGSALPTVLAALVGLLAVTLLLSYALQGAVLRLRLGAVAHRLAVLEAGAALAGRQTCTFVRPVDWVQVRDCWDDGKEIRVELAAEVGWPYPAAVRAVGRVAYGAEWGRLPP